jgi:cytochrome oxidase assembly protein ShyY1
MAFTVAMAALVVGMVAAALWQLDRLGQRRDRNDRVAAALTTPPAPLDGLDAVADEWRTVQVRGTYAVDDELFVGFRSYEGAPGYHVLTPLVADDGRAVLVNRGWVPVPTDPDVAPASPAPPAGTVVVEGRLRPPQDRGALGPGNRIDETRRTTPRVNVAAIAAWSGLDLAPAYVELTAADPAPTGDLPRPVPPPALGDGPHLSYAMQWFIFSTVPVIGWVIVVRRELRRAQGRLRPGEAAIGDGSVRSGG